MVGGHLESKLAKGRENSHQSEFCKEMVDMRQSSQHFASGHDLICFYSCPFLMYLSPYSMARQTSRLGVSGSGYPLK